MLPLQLMFLLATMASPKSCASVPEESSDVQVLDSYEPLVTASSSVPSSSSARVMDSIEPLVPTTRVWVTPLKVEYLARPVDLIIIQHTVTPKCNTNAECVQIVRNIQTNQMDYLNYQDIGPSFLVGGNGKVYEGTGWLHVGEHTSGYNGKSIGISFIGNYNNDNPTEASLDALKALLRCGVEQGHLTANYHIVGHKQLIATQSPGRKLYHELRSMPNFLSDASSIKN